MTRRLAQVHIANERWERLVFHLDLPDGILSDFLRLRRYGGDFVALPLDLLADILDDTHRLHPEQRLGGRHVQGLDLGVGVRAAQNLAEEQPGPVDVVSILGVAARLGRAVNADDTLADQSSLASWRPIVLARCHGFRLLQLVVARASARHVPTPRLRGRRSLTWSLRLPALPL